jgi:polyisoprenoid-binding protein YceI
MKIATTLFLLLLCMPFHAIAKSEFFAIDSVHTRVVFRVMHAGLSPSIGTISSPSGHIWFDEQDITQSSVKIQIPVNRLDMGDLDWTNKILSTTYLSAEKFPIATFESTSVVVGQENKFAVNGILSIAGGSIPIMFNVILNAHKRHPLTFKDTIGLQATTQFSRKALGLDAWPSLIDDTVYMDVAIEANKSSPPTKETSNEAH